MAKINTPTCISSGDAPDPFNGRPASLFVAEQIAALTAERDALRAQVGKVKKELVSARNIIAEIDAYQKDPERGKWGVECACCMGELLDGDREALIGIDAALVRKETP